MLANTATKKHTNINICLVKQPRPFVSLLLFSSLFCFSVFISIIRFEYFTCKNEFIVILVRNPFVLVTYVNGISFRSQQVNQYSFHVSNDFPYFSIDVRKSTVKLFIHGLSTFVIIFIHTAHNIVEYVERSWKILKSGDV